MSDPHAGAPADRFVIEACLGSGTSGSVYRAYDRVRGATVAIKVLERVEPDSLFRFKGEFRQLTSIAHPNLLQLHELTARGDQWILSMELIEGCDLLAYVRPLSEAERRAAKVGWSDSLDEFETQGLSMIPPANDGRRRSSVPRSSLPPLKIGGQLHVERLRAALRQLCDGLHALHATRRVHRDLKPANVLVSSADGRVVICDFGLVVHGHVSEDDRQGTTPDTYADTMIAGTPAYMSPEQMEGRELSAASDWYAVGLMLYQALTGVLPFDPRLPWRDLLRARHERTPPHPCSLERDVPRDLGNLAVALLHPRPAMRPDYKRIVSVLEGTDRLSSPTEEVDQLVGREAQLAQLRGAFSRARGGQCTLALVSGRSGMGKSALIQSFLEGVRTRDDAIVLAGRCYEREDLPYKAIDPLMDALSTCLLQLDRSLLHDLPGLQALARMFPVLRRLPTLAKDAPDALDPVEQRHLAFSALRELCRRLARVGPLVLYIDDLQWGDRDSAPLLIALLRGPRAPGLLMLCAFRAEDAASSPLVRALGPSQLALAGISEPLEISVSELSPDEARALARTLLGGAAAAEEAVELVVNEAHGSPFFVRELASYVRAHGLASAQALTLENVIAATLATLSSESRTLLSVIATAGRPERRAVIETAAKLGPKVFPAYRSLEGLRLIQSAGFGGTGTVEPYHDKIRETAYQALSDRERTVHHRALVEALEIEHGEAADPDLLHEHARAAGDRERAAEYALRAAKRAEGLLAYERAAKLYQEALALRGEGHAEARAITERLAYALMYSGKGPEAADAFFRAVEGADEETAMELRGLAIAQLLRAGLVPRAFDELSRARELLAMPAPTTTLKAIGMLLWRRLRIRLRGLRLRRNPRGLTPALRNRMDLLWSVSGALSPIDQLRAGVYQAEHMLLAMRAGDLYRYARALAIEATTYATGNRNPERTRWVLDRALDAGGASREPHALSVAFGISGVCRMLEGRFLESIRLTRQTLDLQRERLQGKLAWDRMVIEVFELRTRAMAGQVHEIAQRVPDLLRDAEARGDLYASVSLRTSTCCWAWLGPDLPEVAREQVELAARQWTQAGYNLQHWYTTQAICFIALYTGDLDEARARLDREWKPMFMLRKKIQFTRADTLCMRARLALAAVRKTGERSELAQVRRDGRALLRERNLWITAHGRLLLACADSFDAPERAAATLYEVEGQFEAADMKLHAAVCGFRRGQLLGAAGGQLVDSATEVMRRLGVARPDAFADMLAPGFPSTQR